MSIPRKPHWHTHEDLFEVIWKKELVSLLEKELLLTASTGQDNYRPTGSKISQRVGLGVLHTIHPAF